MLSPLGPAEQLQGGSRLMSANSFWMRLALALSLDMAADDAVDLCARAEPAKRRATFKTRAERRKEAVPRWLEGKLNGWQVVYAHSLKARELSALEESNRGAVAAGGSAAHLMMHSWDACDCQAASNRAIDPFQKD